MTETETHLIDPAPAHRGIADYILPFGNGYGKWNPWSPETHPFGKDWLAGGYAYLVQRLDQDRWYPTRILHSAGPAGDDWRIGNRWTVRHDQTNALLGEYLVVGIVVYGEDGEILEAAGDVPTRKIHMATFK